MEAISEVASFVSSGVVLEPGQGYLEIRPPGKQVSFGEMVADNVLAALEAVRADLGELRAQRTQINLNIKRRVAEEALLARMARIAEEMKEVRDEDDAGPDGPEAVDA